jgi:hypothetical protein
MDTKSSNATFWKHHVEQCAQSCSATITVAGLTTSILAG